MGGGGTRLQVGDPSQIGSFRLLGRLGEGGMGRVFLGESPGGRKVAIKVVHPHYASDPEFRRRFAREVATARRVGGFHTAAVVGADPGADPPWMATAYIPGPSLAEAITLGGPLDEAGVRELGAALAEGLTAIHDCGLIHRDLKPGNVILADDGPRIIDFGIAKGADATALTGSNAIIGTLRYMSPEQLHGHELTPQSDVFALGTVLAYAATGHDPFQGPTIPAVITRILNDPPDLDPLTGDLRGIIGDCLTKDPGNRPSLGDLLARFSRPAPRDPTVIAAPAPVHAAALPPEPRSADVREPEQPAENKPGPDPAIVAAQGPPADAASAVATETNLRHSPGAVLDSARAPASSPWPAPGMQPPRRRHRMMIAAVVAAVVVLAAGGVAGWLAQSGGATSPGLVWAAARAPLPAGAATGSSFGASLWGVACPAADICVAVGSYGNSDSSTAPKPLIETLSNGTWTATSDVAGAEVSELYGVACPAQDSCAAVGYSSAPGQGLRPVVATLSGGSWTATGLPLPAGADQSGNAYLEGVQCPAQGACIAAGTYTDQNGGGHALIETLSDGTWTAARASLPAGAVPSQVTADAALNSTACPEIGSCTAVGSYAGHGGTYPPFVDTLSGGTWTPVTALQPAGATVFGLFAISCRAPGDCLAVGKYINHRGQPRYLTETLSRGSWTLATLPLPANGAASQSSASALQLTSLDAVACQAAGSCVTLGSYISASGAVDGAIDTLSGGTWTAATAPLPSGAATTKQHSYLRWVVCPAPGNCVAVGAYTTQDGTAQALIETAIGKHG